MHGLILRALRGYLIATLGSDRWRDVLDGAGLHGEQPLTLLFGGSEALRRALESAARLLGRSCGVIMEETGVFVVTCPVQPVVRRLLRLGGATFEEFLHSLEELPDRARLALPVYDFPRVDLDIPGPGVFRLRCHAPSEELLGLALGALRAMAADYGQPATIERTAAGEGMEIVIRLIDASRSGWQRSAVAATG